MGMTDTPAYEGPWKPVPDHIADLSPRVAPMPSQATDLIVRTRNPELLDQTVQQLGAAVVVEGSFNGETCRVRVFGAPGYMKFAITNQGYGEIVGEEKVS